MALTSGKNESLFSSSLCDFIPGLRRLETVLEIIAVHFKRKITRIFLQELFGVRITICLIERSSLVVVFRGLLGSEM